MVTLTRRWTWPALLGFAALAALLPPVCYGGELGTVAALKQLEQDGKLKIISDRRVLAKVDEVWPGLANAAGVPDTQVVVVELSGQPNARAFGDGVVAFDRRLTEALPDDQWPFIMAHELGHLAGLHSERHGTKWEWPEGLRPAVNEGHSSWWDRVKDKATEYTLRLWLGEFDASGHAIRYSQGIEYEADERGLAIMQRAGLNARNGILALGNMEDDFEHGADTYLASRYLSDHPPLADRVRNAHEYMTNVLEPGPSIVYEKEDGLWVCRKGDRGSRRIIEGTTLSSPTPSPRGGRVAVLRDLDWWLVDIPTAHQVRLTTQGRRDWQWMSGQPVSGHDADQLSVVGDCQTLCWAPGGDRVACASGNGLWTVTVDGRDKACLDKDEEAYNTKYAPVLAWSPDGNAIACLSQLGRSLRLVILPLDGGQRRDISLRLPWGFTRWFAGPGLLFSPDGTYIACPADKAVAVVRTSDGVVVDQIGMSEPDYHLAWIARTQLALENTVAETAGLTVVDVAPGGAGSRSVARPGTHGAPLTVQSFVRIPSSPPALAVVTEQTETGPGAYALWPLELGPLRWAGGARPLLVTAGGDGVRMPTARDTHVGLKLFIAPGHPRQCALSTFRIWELTRPDVGAARGISGAYGWACAAAWPSPCYCSSKHWGMMTQD